MESVTVLDGINRNHLIPPAVDVFQPEQQAVAHLVEILWIVKESESLENHRLTPGISLASFLTPTLPDIAWGLPVVRISIPPASCPSCPSGYSCLSVWPEALETLQSLSAQTRCCTGWWRGQWVYACHTPSAAPAETHSHTFKLPGNSTGYFRENTNNSWMKTKYLKRFFHLATLSFLMRCSMVWISVQSSGLRCCSSSSSVCTSQVQMFFRSEFSCCHCCWFCFVRISLLRSWACRSSQRSITPGG